jgi:DNA-binding response OmpR family regulator
MLNVLRQQEKLDQGVLIMPSTADEARAHRVLFVDDQPELWSVVSDGLESEGFSVTCALNARAAREKLTTSKFDLAIVDVFMPGELGISLAHYIAGLQIPVILTSAQPGRVERLDEGVYRVVVKPFRTHQLAAAIRDQLASEPDA